MIVEYIGAHRSFRGQPDLAPSNYYAAKARGPAVTVHGKRRPAGDLIGRRWGLPARSDQW